MNFNDEVRTTLIAFLHAIFPMLNLLGVFVLTVESMAAIQIVISTGITLAFLVFTPGQDNRAIVPKLGTGSGT